MRVFQQAVKDEHLAPLGALKELRMLEITGASLTGAALRHLSGCKKLQTLDIAGMALTAEQAGTLHTLFPELKSIHLGPGCLTEETLRVVGQFKWLEKLGLFNNTLPDEMLAPLTGLTGLRTLDLNSCGKFNGTGLAAFTGSTELRSIKCSYKGAPVTGTALPVIARTFPKLETLDLAVKDAKDADFKALSALRNLSSLKLSIIADVSDDSLATLASLPGLQVLDIEGDTHTAAGLEHLLASKSLTTLVLNGGKTMDASIVPVLKTFKNLKSLDIKGIPAKSAADEIRKALPGCKVMDK